MKFTRNNEYKLHNKGVDAEKPAGSRVLLTQHPRPSLISGHDSRYDKINGRIEELNTTGQQDNKHQTNP